MSPSSSVTAFYGQVRGAKYRAAIVQQSGANCYLWTWFDTPGTIIDFSLVDGATRIFPKTIETHESLHASGQVHTRIVMKNGSKRVREILSRKDRWHDLERTVPLDSIPIEALDQGPWNDVNTEIVLRSCDFGNAAGVNLIFCLATPDRMASLKRQWACHWVLSGDRTIVVGAEPIPYPKL
jgi:hypothetical protein